MKSPEDFLPGGRCCGFELPNMLLPQDIESLAFEMAEHDGWLGLVEDSPDRAAEALRLLHSTVTELYDQTRRMRNYVKMCAVIANHANRPIEEER